MNLILLLIVAFVLLGFAEHVRHERALRRLPIRIHVNGSRGKSSVTRLIAAGLRAGGIRTVAKTTGSAARYIHPDGSEEPVRRKGSPNIKEQIAVVRQAAAEGAQALVIECMAVRPDLQAVSEDKIVKSTIGVITNVRPDHLEVMGPGLENVARSLAGTVPTRGRLFSAERRFSELFARVAERRGATLCLSDPESVGAGDLDAFSYVEHPENVSLALDVCQVVGVAREIALSGMRSATPDVGALTRMRLGEGEKTFEFVNAFAANDPASTSLVWERLGLANRDPKTLVLVINLRGDRMRRSKDLAGVVHRTLRAGTYLLIGDQTRLFLRLALRAGAPPESLVDLGGASVEEVYGRMVEVTPAGSTVVGVGNIGGAGGALFQYLEARGGGS